MSGKDTVFIKKFDSDGHLIFHKIFPQYGVSMIFAKVYSLGKISSSIWAHSNVGFIEDEFLYNEDNDTVSIYSYDAKNTEIKNLMEYHSIESLKKSKDFQTYLLGAVRYLKTIQYYQDSLIVKEEEYRSDGTINNTMIYQYSDGLLVSKSLILPNGEIDYNFQYFYNAEGLGVRYIKIFTPIDTSKYSQEIFDAFSSGNDTSFIFVNEYEEGRLKKSEFFEGKDLHKTSTEIYEYSDGKLIFQKKYNADGKLKISSDYHYNKNGTIAYIIYFNSYFGRKEKIQYFY